MIRLKLVLAFLFAGAAPLLAQDEERGPLEAHSPTIFQLSSTDFIPTVPLSLREDELQFRLVADWANTFSAEQYMVDVELLHLRPSLWYGITEQVNVGIALPINFVGGGRMDNLIDSVHHLLHHTNDRALYARNEFQATLPSGSHNYASRALLGDLMLQSQYKFIENTHYGLLMGNQLQLPTSTRTEWYDRRMPGIGGYLAGFYDLGDFRFFASVGIASVGETYILEQKLRPWQAAAVLGADFQVCPGFSFVAQFTNVSGPANFEEYSRWSVEFALGARYHIANGVSVELGCTENLFYYANSADFGIHFGLVIK